MPCFYEELDWIYGKCVRVYNNATRVHTPDMSSQQIHSSLQSDALSLQHSHTSSHTQHKCLPTITVNKAAHNSD